MKKIICLLMIMMLLMTGLNGFAENATGRFDYSAFEDMEDFKVDKFDKTWTISTAAIGSNTSAVFALTVRGTPDGKLQYILLGPRDSKLNLPERLQFLIDETVYSFDLSTIKDAAGVSGIFLAKENIEFFEHFASANEVSIKVTCDGTASEDTFSAESLRESQEIIHELLRQDAVSCYSEDAEQLIHILKRDHLQDMEIS